MQSSSWKFGLSATPSAATTGQSSWPIVQQCSYYKQQIKRAPLKELHQIFPRLLSSVFGFDGGLGWRLKFCHKTQHPVQYSAGYSFLSPGGDLFLLIAKLDENQSLYEFPINCLPYPSQLALTEGVIPPFYQGKVQLQSLGSTNYQQVPDHVYLSAFEYYFFHFAYYLLYNQVSNSSQARLTWSSLPDCLYSNLLDAYLYHFLPLAGPIPGPVSMGMGTSSFHQQSPVSSHTPLYGNSPVISSPQGHTHLGLLKLNGHGSPHRMGVVYSGSTTPLRQTDLGAQTELFLQTLIEFWLVQNTSELSYGKHLTQTQVGSTCSQEQQVRFIRMMLKHVLYFSNGSCQSASISPFSSTLLSVTESLRQSVVTLFLQKPIYQFISNAFRHWPLDETFRYILELWLTYLQPWRYTDPTKPSSDNKDSSGTVPKKWKPYVLEHFPFYSTLFLAMLERSFQLDLTSNFGVTLLYRVSKVFSQPGLGEFIRLGEKDLLFSDPVHSAITSHSSPSAVSSLKNLFEVLEGPSFQYQPVFDLLIYEALQVLFGNIQQARSQLCMKFDSHAGSGAQSETDKKSFFSSLWQGMFESDSPGRGTPAQNQDPKKLVGLLEASEANLRSFFKLPGSEDLSSSFFVSSSRSFDGSPHLHVPPSPSSSHLSHYVDHTHLATPPTSIEAEYESGGSKLTPEGKEQVKSGLRICNRTRVTSLGDPLLQPIRSYENTTLVRALHRLSCYLNQKFSSQLTTIGSSNRLRHKLLLQLLAPPLPSSLPPQPPATPTTPTSRASRCVPFPSEAQTQPRISLRVFGSYYTLTYIFILLLLIWSLSIPLTVVGVAFVLFVLVYCTFRYCFRST